jgi:hypothetical protein
VHFGFGCYDRFFQNIYFVASLLEVFGGDILDVDLLIRCVSKEKKILRKIYLRVFD